MKTTMAILGLLLTMFTVGCDGGHDTGTGAESALLVGSVERGLTDEPAAPAPGKLTVYVNNQAAQTEVGEDLDFAVRQMPTGDVAIEVEVDGIRGTLDLDDVQPGEIIEVTIRVAPDALAIGVVRRTPPAEAPVEDISPPIHDEPIVIRGHHTVYRFAPGIYRGDVTVTGHHITLIGAPNPTCAEDGGTVIEGDLRLEGHHIRVVGVTAQGGLELPGKTHHVSMTASACEGLPWGELDDDDHDGDFDEDRHEDRHED